MLITLNITIPSTTSTTGRIQCSAHIYDAECILSSTRITGQSVFRVEHVVHWLQ